MVEVSQHVSFCSEVFSYAFLLCVCVGWCVGVEAGVERTRVEQYMYDLVINEKLIKITYL